MKKLSQMLKRVLASVLAVLTVMTAGNFGFVASVFAHDAEHDHTHVTLGQLIVENYDELSDNEKLIIQSGQLTADQNYAYVAPNADDGEGLIAIDEKTKTITASVFTDKEGNKWYPDAYQLIADEQVKEEGSLSTGEVTYEYAGNAFAVKVTYVLEKEVTEEDQKAVLNAGSLLAADIAKLMLLKGNIIPAKPEGWDEMTQDEKENHASYEDIVKHEALQKFVDSATGQKPGESVKLTPELVLTLMVMPVLDYGDKTGLSVVDLIAMLAGLEIDPETNEVVESGTDGIVIGGVQVPAALIDALEEDLEMLEYDEKTGTVEAVIGITRNANTNAAAALLGEKAQYGNLLMGKFLLDHNADSYLEWLMVAATYAQLVEAVSSNYDDIYQLLDSKYALSGVLEDLNALYTDVENLEMAAWKMISTTAAEYGLTIENETQLNNALTPDGFDELLASQMDPLNDKLPELKQALTDAGYTDEAATVPAEITTKAGLVDLIDTLTDVKNDAQSKLTTALNLFNNELTAYGYTGAVAAETLTDDIAAVESWLNGRITTEKGKITTALATANALLEGTDYEGTVSSAADIETAITWLTNNAGAELQAAQQLVASKLAAANTLAQSFGYTTQIVNAAGVDAVGTWLEEQIAADETTLQGYVDTANDYIAEANKELPEAQRYNGTIATSGDIDGVITWMGEQVTYAEDAYADALVTLNQRLRDELGYDGEDITGSADFDAKINAWIDGKVAELDQYHADACAAINEQLRNNGINDKTVDEAADVQKLLDAFDEAYDTLNTTLSPYKSNFKSCPHPVETVSDLDVWISTLKEANEGWLFKGQFTDAINTLEELRPTYVQIDALRPHAETALDALTQLEDAKAALTGEDMTNALAAIKTEMVNGEAKIAEAKDMQEEYTDLLTSAKNKMAQMEQDIAADKAALPGRKAQLADAKAAIVAAEEALANVDDPSATVIPALREQQSIINAANAQIAADEDELDSVASWKSDLTTANDALTTLSGAITAMEEGLAAANEAYATLESVAENLDVLGDTKAELKSTVSMMDVLITLLDLFCEAIKPIYDSCKADDWNVRDELLPFNNAADYDALTAAATGLIAPTVSINETLNVTTQDVTHKMSMFDVTVSYEAVVVDPSKTDSTDTLALTTKTQKVTLVAGATADDILAAIAEKLPAEDTYLVGWGISADKFVRAASELPAELTEDITYTISYAPKMMTITLDNTFNGEVPESVPYGYRMTLPAHDDVLYEWEYTVNGESKIRQGTVVTIVEDTAISRKAGAASEQYKLTDLVIETTPALTANEKAILQSLALKLNKVVYVRMPNGSLVTVVRDSDLGQTTVTAEPYDSNVAGNWTVSTGLMDGAPVTFTNGVLVTDAVFQQIVASYKLYMTAAQLGLTDEALEEYLNVPYILSSDYHFQKSTLDTLVASLTIDDPQDEGSDAAPLEALALLRKDYTVPFNGQNLLLGNLLGSLPTLNESLGMGLSDTTIQAAADLLAILPESGNVPLYDTLMLYQSDKGGMEHYYKNEQTYINQITQLSGLMNALTGDTTLMGMLGSYKTQFDVINNALKTAAALGEDENRIRTDLINVNSPALSNLLDALAEGDVSAHTAPDKLEWTVNITKAGPTSKSYTVKVDVFGNVKSETYVVGIDDPFNHEADQLAILTGNNMIPTADMMYYQYAVNETTDDEGNPVYTYTYGYKSFDATVTLDGQEVSLGTVSMEQLMITLPVHPDSENFRWDYVVDGKAYSAGGDVELTTGQFKALVNGELSITRTLVDLEQERLEQEEEEKRKQEQQLIADLGGLGVLTKVEDGKYALVLNLNIDDPKTSLMGFVVSLVTNPYDTILLGSTELYAVEDYGDKAPKQIHLQALIDLILNSGLTDDALLGMIANGAFKNDFTLPGTYIEMDGEGNPIAYGDLGTQFVQSTLTFQKADKDDLVVDFYVTLSGSGDMVGTLQSALGKLPEGVGLELNGGVSISADLPGVIYTAYLAALSMVGEVDVDAIDQANSEAVFGYMLELLDPVIDGENVTLATITNTLAQFGVNYDLSAYEGYFNTFKGLYDLNNVVYTDNGFVMALNDIDISSVIAQLQDMVDTMELPGGMKLNLANLIYEYDDPAYADDEYGLDVKLGVGLGNVAEDYNVIFVDVKADGIANKLGMTTADKLALQATSVVVLVGNVEGDLVFNGTTTFVDLNGFTVSGNICGINGADVYVVDSDYTADGGANGVSGTVTVLGGKYVNDVTEFVGEGYEVKANGTVGNRLFTVTETADTITVTLNATPEDVKSLLSQQGVIELAAEVLIDLVINHYNAAALSMDGNTIYNINFNNLLSLVSGDRSDLIDTALACISVSDLADVFNAIVADLTDFEGMAVALAEGGDGIISEHDFTTATWALALGHDATNDVLTVNLGASTGSTETKTFQIAVVGDARDDMAILTAALADTVTVESDLTLADIVRNGDRFAINGSYAGSVVVDFVKNPGYVLAMTVILADGTTDAALKADLVDAIEAYAETGDMYALSLIYNTLSIKDICDALVNHVDEFDDMVAGLGLSDEAAAVIVANVTDNEMGYELLVDVVSYALFLLDSRDIGESITGSGRTLGTFEKRDSKGLYYGFEKSGSVDKAVSIVDVAMDITNVTVKLYMFKDHTCDLTEHPETPAACETDGNSAYWSCDVCGKFFSDAEGKNEIEKDSWITNRTGHAWGETTYEWSDDGKTCTAKRVCGNDETHVETADAVITFAEKTPATCTVKGWTTYTATFEGVEWATTQTKNVQDIATLAHTYDQKVTTEDYLKSAADCENAAVYYYSCSCGEKGTETFEHGTALGHAWGETTYEWSDDGKTCTAKRVCGNDETHVETADAVITSAEKTPATCTVKGWTTYTATFTATWATTQTKDVQDIATLAHTYDKKVVSETYLKSAADCENAAVYYYSCSCGAKGTETFTDGEALGHSYGAATYEWSADGKTCTAKHVCANDASHVETAAAVITSAEKTPASCTEMGWTTYTATFTATWATTQTKDVQDIATLAHTYDKKVVSETYLKSAADCENAAVYYYSCSCGAKGTETFTDGEALGHIDTDKDHKCDHDCGETFGKCEDADMDGYCDYGCGEEFPPEVGVPEIPVGDNVLGFKVDADEGLLYLDTVRAGMSVEDFVALLKEHVDTQYDADGCAVTVEDDHEGLIATGTQVTVTAKNLTGVDSVTYEIVVMGDTNGNGRIESGDAVKIANHYCGVSKLTGSYLLAGDINCNGRLESGDAVKIGVKYVNGENYISKLGATEQ